MGEKTACSIRKTSVIYNGVRRYAELHLHKPAWILRVRLYASSNPFLPLLAMQKEKEGGMKWWHALPKFQMMGCSVVTAS